jgi:hypothetical protein
MGWMTTTSRGCCADVSGRDCSPAFTSITPGRCPGANAHGRRRCSMPRLRSLLVLPSAPGASSSLIVAMTSSWWSMLVGGSTTHPGFAPHAPVPGSEPVQLHMSPPRVRLETAALMAASRESSGDRAVALLGDLLQQRRTTSARLRTALADLSRLPRHRLLAEVLDDVSTGALERRYLRDVERAHRLPRGRRQHRVTAHGRRQQRDVDYPSYGVDVELDGRLGHELWRDRWADLDRDLRSLREGTITLRAGWGQVLQPCRLADGVAAVLAARGWDGRPIGCGPDCALT